MKSSIGTESPDALSDGDRNGVADRAERDFARDGESDTRTEPPRTPAGATSPDHEDDKGLESSRPVRGAVVPPTSN